MKTVGSRAEVWHGTAKKTSGGLLKKDLKKNKRGRIVSKKMSNRAKKEKRLEKAGYKTKKGVFKKFKAKKKKRGGGHGMSKMGNTNKTSTNSVNKNNLEMINGKAFEIHDKIAEYDDLINRNMEFEELRKIKKKEHGTKHILGLVQQRGMFENKNMGRLAQVNSKMRNRLEMPINRRKKEILKRLTENGTITINEALIKAVSKGDESDVRFLLNVEADKEVKDEQGMTPLHLATLYGNTDIVKLLLDAGAKKDVKNNYGETPFHYAARDGYTGIVKLLLDAGADKEVMGRNGYTPLHYAAEEGNTAVVKVLLDAGANKDVRDENGETPLHKAAWKGNTRIVQELLNQGVEVDLQDYHYQTPLHQAANRGHTDIVKLLLDAGADKEVKDMFVRTPLHWAAESAHTDIVKLLKSHKSKGGSKKRRKRKTTKRKSKK